MSQYWEQRDAFRFSRTSARSDPPLRVLRATDRVRLCRETDSAARHGFGAGGVRIHRRERLEPEGSGRALRSEIGTVEDLA